jgi:hypothetical protein
MTQSLQKVWQLFTNFFAQICTRNRRKVFGKQQNKFFFSYWKSPSVATLRFVTLCPKVCERKDKHLLVSHVGFSVITPG